MIEQFLIKYNYKTQTFNNIITRYLKIHLNLTYIDLDMI